MVIPDDELHQALPTRLGAPLWPATMRERPVRSSHPAVAIADDAWIVATHPMAVVAVTEFGARVADLTAKRSTLLAAIDRLVTGI